MNCDKDELLQVPLIVKESSDIRHHRLLRLILILLVVCNVCWGSTFVAYTSYVSHNSSVTCECLDMGCTMENK